jgi:hypothetical protein
LEVDVVTTIGKFALVVFLKEKDLPTLTVDPIVGNFCVAFGFMVTVGATNEIGMILSKL